MERLALKAEVRTIRGKHVGALRRAGKLPGVIYGHHVESTAITMDLRDATLLLAGRTASSLVTIDLEGKQISVLVREKQRDFIRGTLRHVDFQAVSLSEKIRANVRVVVHGVSPAVKDFNGIVTNGLQELEVEALPQDLPEQFVIDISKLKQIGEGIYVRDITVSDKVQVLDHPEEMIVVIANAAKEEEAVSAEGATAAEPEVIERGKKEEEEEG